MTKEAGKVRKGRRVEEVGIWAYLWDLLDEGVEPAIDALRGWHFSSLNVAVLYHAGRFLLPHNPRRKVYILEGGTAYFVPRGDYGRLRPPANSLTRDGDPLARVVKAARDRGMKVRAWTALTHNYRLGAANPDCAVVNAFGDVCPTLLCPSHPDVQEYCVRSCRDLLKHYDFDGLQIETLDFWGWGLSQGFHHEKIGIELSDRANWLLSLCFCAHCEAGAPAAGIDVAGLRHRAVSLLNEHFASGKDVALAGSEAEELDRFQRWRTEVVTGAVRRLRDEVFAGTDRRLDFIVSPEPFWLRNAGVDPIELVKVVDGFVLMAYYSTRQQLAGAVGRFAVIAPASRSTVGLQLCHPFPSDSRRVAAILHACLERGYRSFSFYNYGLVPVRVLKEAGRAIAEFSISRPAVQSSR